MNETAWYEYGYRTTQTGEVWAGDYGPDGSWTPWLPEFDINNIEGAEVASIRRELSRAGVNGTVLRRLVKRIEGDAEIVTG